MGAPTGVFVPCAGAEGAQPYTVQAAEIAKIAVAIVASAVTAGARRAMSRGACAVLAGCVKGILLRCLDGIDASVQCPGCETGWFWAVVWPEGIRGV